MVQWVELCPQGDRSKPNALVPVNMTIHGNRIFADVIKMRPQSGTKPANTFNLDFRLPEQREEIVTASSHPGCSILL